MGENRHRHTVWMDDAVWDQVESHSPERQLLQKNEYIEKAIQFYSGYLTRSGPMSICPEYCPTYWMASWGPGQTDGTPAVSWRWRRTSWEIWWPPGWRWIWTRCVRRGFGA